MAAATGRCELEEKGKAMLLGRVVRHTDSSWRGHAPLVESVQYAHNSQGASRLAHYVLARPFAPTRIVT